MLLLTGHISLIPNFTEGKNRKAIMTSEMKIKDLLDVYKIDETVNRDVNYNKILKLEKYIKQMDTELGIYIPALMLAFEGDNPERDKNQFLFKKNRDFIVLDGQHRIKALERYIEREKNTRKIAKILESKITIQVYFNLTEKEKRQLFIEINGKSKRVSQNISVKFDDRNPMNTLVSDLLKRGPLLKMGVEQRVSRMVRPSNKNWISMKRLSQFISYLLLGTQSPSDSNKEIIKNQYEEIFSFLQQFFNYLETSLPKNPGDVIQNILGHEAIQNAIAVVCHNLIVENKNSKLKFSSNWKQYVEMLEYIDWGTDSTLFKEHLVLSGGNKKYIRFSDNKHYDLVPLLKDELSILLNLN